MAEGYIIENVVGNAGTRYHRYLSPSTQRKAQFIAGMRVLPQGKLPITEEVFRREMAAIKKGVLAGTFVLYTPDRMKITSTHTGQFILVRADGATKMLPPGEEPECFWAEAAKPAPEPVPVPKPAPEPVFTSAEPTPAPEPEDRPDPYDVEPDAPVTEPKKGKRRK